MRNFVDKHIENNIWKIVGLILCATLLIPAIQSARVVASFRVVATNDKYEILTNGKQYCLRLHNKLKAEFSDFPHTFQETNWPTFASVADMKQTFLSGDFTRDELKSICLDAGRNDFGYVIIPNLEQLYDATHPSSNVEYVAWSGNGEGYTIAFYGWQADVRITPITEAQYNSFYESYTNEKQGAFIADPEGWHGYTVYEYYEVYPRIRHYDLSTYDLVKGSAYLYVSEKYGNTNDVPSEVRFFSSNDGVYFYGRVALKPSNAKRPTPEWLKGFAVIPYVETE